MISSPITNTSEYLKKYGSVNHLGGKKEDEDKDMDGIQVRK